jgi:hypothetical protein
VVALVTRAGGSDPTAWEEIVARYAPLVWSICARFELSNHDREDVGQKVRLLLVEQLGKPREPAALPGWIVTTTHRECLRVVAAARKNGAAWDRTRRRSAIRGQHGHRRGDPHGRAERGTTSGVCGAPTHVPAVAGHSHQRPRRFPTRRSARRCRSWSGASVGSELAAWNGCASPARWLA